MKTIDSVLESHGPCESIELSIVQVRLETTEIRVTNKTRIAPAARVGTGARGGGRALLRGTPVLPAEIESSMRGKRLEDLKLDAKSDALSRGAPFSTSPSKQD